MAGMDTADASTAGPRGGVTGYLYDAQGRDREVAVDAEVVAGLHHQALLWIDVIGRDEAALRELASTLRLDAKSLADLLEPRPAPRLDNFGRYLQFSLPVAPQAIRSSPDGEDEAPPAGAARLDFAVGENWVLTVHDNDLQFLRGFRAQDKADTQIGALSAAALTASLLDWHLEAFFAEVARIELVIDHLEERVLADPSAERLLSRILTVRRRVSHLRRLLGAQRPVFYGLSRPDVARLADTDAGHAQVLASRFERAVDETEHARDLVVGSFELFNSRSSQQTNDLVKVLTFFTVILGCAAAIAGLFGMNFDPPFFRSGATGFFAVTGGLGLVGLTAWFVGKRRGWI